MVRAWPSCVAFCASHPELAHLTVAVNVSAGQLRAADFVQEVLATLALTGANPSQLKLELTESQLVFEAFALKLQSFI